MKNNTDQLLLRAFARIDAIALGVAVGVLAGGGLCAATLALLIKGGPHVGRNLSLLNQYFPGYTVTWPGAFVGLAYGFAAGFIGGWLLAWVRNLVVALYVLIIKMKSAAAAGRSFFDNL
ncbi:MAG: hypothetical protein WCS70_09800 [Verrucomicrobiota bacterium]